MDVCVFGWYGTETLGDRAILDGIIQVFGKRSPSMNVRIGSLYPTLTERTICEDRLLWNSHGSLVAASCFDAYSKKEMHDAISKSDWVIMGGGPLMDLSELYIVLHAFKYAKKRAVPTVLLGCGYGPLAKDRFKQCVKKIAGYSDLIIMRSKSCKESMELLCNSKNQYTVYSSADPAMISAVSYAAEHAEFSADNTNNMWVINIRDLDYVNCTNQVYYEKTRAKIKSLLKQLPSVIFLANHTFSIGGDDRYIANRLLMDLGPENAVVQQRPLTLMETYDFTAKAKGCVGMRYHSIVFQTYLNGNNYIIDYTDKETGKIKAYLKSFDKTGFYNDRYININDDAVLPLKLEDDTRYQYDRTSILECISQYNKMLDTVR